MVAEYHCPLCSGQQPCEHQLFPDKHSDCPECDRLRSALQVIADCPPEAVHLMPLAAQAALRGEGQ